MKPCEVLRVFNEMGMLFTLTQSLDVVRFSDFMYSLDSVGETLQFCPADFWAASIFYFVLIVPACTVIQLDFATYSAKYPTVAIRLVCSVIHYFQCLQRNPFHEIWRQSC